MDAQDQRKKLIHTTFLQREYALRHHTYDEEMLQYEYVKRGDMRSIQESQRIFKNGNTGTLSKDPLRSVKYLFVAAMTLVTRFVIEGGLEAETAYTLSDLYIQQADDCQSVKAVQVLHAQMIEDMTRRMVQDTKRQHYSKPIHRCLDYIYNNLHTRLSIQLLAEEVHLSPNHLSVLFKRETGLTIAGYIRHKRLEAAENLLVYSDFTFLEISNYLMFSSLSHFIKLFKQHSGQTPKTYRDQHFRHAWPKDWQL